MDYISAFGPWSPPPRQIELIQAEPQKGAPLQRQSSLRQSPSKNGQVSHRILEMRLPQINCMVERRVLKPSELSFYVKQRNLPALQRVPQALNCSIANFYGKKRYSSFDRRIQAEEEGRVSKINFCDNAVGMRRDGRSRNSSLNAQFAKKRGLGYFLHQLQKGMIELR